MRCRWNVWLCCLVLVPQPALAGACVLRFHAPEGELLILSDTIKAIRPIDRRHHEHVAPGIRSVLYLGVAPRGFGVTETAPEVLQMIRSCEN